MAYLLSNALHYLDVCQGKTREEALENIQDAIKGYFASLKKRNEPIPPPIEEEIVEVVF